MRLLLANNANPVTGTTVVVAVATEVLVAEVVIEVVAAEIAEAVVAIVVDAVETAEAVVATETGVQVTAANDEISMAKIGIHVQTEMTKADEIVAHGAQPVAMMEVADARVRRADANSKPVSNE
jgi:hypothetical protein